VGDAGLDFIISDFYEVCRARTVCLTSALNKENGGYLLRKQTRTWQRKHGNARSAANNVLHFVQKTDLRSASGLLFASLEKKFLSLSLFPFHFYSLSLSLSLEQPPNFFTNFRKRLFLSYKFCKIYCYIISIM